MTKKNEFQAMVNYGKKDAENIPVILAMIASIMEQIASIGKANKIAFSPIVEKIAVFFAGKVSDNEHAQNTGDDFERFGKLTLQAKHAVNGTVSAILMAMANGIKKKALKDYAFVQSAKHGQKYQTPIDSANCHGIASIIANVQLKDGSIRQFCEVVHKLASRKYETGELSDDQIAHVMRLAELSKDDTLGLIEAVSTGIMLVSLREFCDVERERIVSIQQRKAQKERDDMREDKVNHAVQIAKSNEDKVTAPKLPAKAKTAKTAK